jgi:hypothetical protein
VVEDMHGADHGTLDLVLYLARYLTAAQVLGRPQFRRRDWDSRHLPDSNCHGDSRLTDSDVHRGVAFIHPTNTVVPPATGTSTATRQAPLLRGRQVRQP